MANFFISIFFFFFFLSGPVCTLAQNYIKRDIAINCGSTGISTSFSGKEWMGDATTSSVVIKGGSSTTTLHSFASNDPIPFETARISVTQFSYTFQVSPGQKLIRLYFRPSSYKHFKKFKDLFTVKAGPFTLLTNFSVSLTCDALGVKSFIKEYYIKIEQDQPLNIIFNPQKIKSGKTYALVNGIEVISTASDHFYYSGDDELGARVVGQKSRFHIDSSIALEMMQRSSFRWDPIVLLDEKTKDFRWKTSVDVGFGYLVRLHFRETSNTVFNLFINDMIAETNVDIGRERSFVREIYRHRDYVVMVKGPKEEGRRDLLISLHLKNDSVSKFFTGLEIFKLSNHENSLASPNLYFPRRGSKSSTLPLSIVSIFGHGNAIVTGAVLVISFINVIVYKLRKIWEASSMEEINKPLALTGKLCRSFSLAEMQLATENFNDALVIGKGGFGNVYRGIISNGQHVVAIKRLKCNSKQGMNEFWTEVEILSKLQHTHIISLIGYCNEYEEMILVYEYIPGGTLADHLFLLDNCISWKQRLSICIGVGRGLEYLHTGTDHEIIHRDIKASNILLDENFEAKISDFGLAKPRKRKQLQNFVNTNVKGTFGYFDPNYFRTRRLTRKSDIYAFGVVLLEVLCGRPALDIRVEDEKQSLTTWARGRICEGEIDEVIDSSLKAQISTESLMTFVELAQRCLYDQPNKRPTMAQVVVQLEYALEQHQKIEMAGSESLNPCTGQTTHTQSISAETTFVDEYKHNKKIPIISSLTEDSNTKRKMALNAEQSNKGIIVYRRKANPYKLPHFWPWDTLRKKPRPTKKNNLSVSEYFGEEVESYKFDPSTIVAATNNFSIKIGEGGFCNVYKGVLPTGQVVAIKRYKSPKTFMQEELFKREVVLVSKLEHPNLVKLVGYCFHDEERIIVYEFMANRGLNAHIFGETRRPKLGWTIRFKIIVGIARGLHYLHQDSGLKIIHRDINRNNILLDKEMNPKISGFSLGRTLEENQTQVRIFGTYGYMAPEYCRDGLLSVKTDVFGFGAVVLEIVSGKRVWNSYFNLFESAWKMWKEGNAIKLLDKSIQDEGTPDEALKCIQVGLLCIQDRPDDRPTMQYVVEMLEGGDPPLPQPSKPAYVYSKLKLSTESTNEVTITK